MDFTLKIYKRLLQALLEAGYTFLTFREYCEGKRAEKLIILRHDVDEYAANALQMARLEDEMDIKATYYFRTVKQSNRPEIIRKIASMGHEIGYHYEDLNSTAGNYEKAIEAFKDHLAYFRTFYPVKTICMHGSSSCMFDNRDLWKYYDIHSFGIIGEPYLSVDFKQIFYMTDTGYAWDGGKYAVRDVVENHFGLSFHSTQQIISAIKLGQFPQQCLILAHTLWTNDLLLWLWLHIREFLRNNIKMIAQRNVFVKKLYSKLVKLYWGNA